MMTMYILLILESVLCRSVDILCMEWTPYSSDTGIVCFHSPNDFLQFLSTCIS
jgi:hypothetical protein